MRRLATQLALIACFVPFFAAFCGVLWVFYGCFRHFGEVSGTTLRKNVKDNILLLLH
jgi:hypothetical protein